MLYKVEDSLDGPITMFHIFFLTLKHYKFEFRCFWIECLSNYTSHCKFFFLTLCIFRAFSREQDHKRRNEASALASSNRLLVRWDALGTRKKGQKVMSPDETRRLSCLVFREKFQWPANLFFCFLEKRRCSDATFL